MGFYALFIFSLEKISPSNRKRVFKINVWFMKLLFHLCRYFCSFSMRVEGLYFCFLEFFHVTIEWKPAEQMNWTLAGWAHTNCFQGWSLNWESIYSERHHIFIRRKKMFCYSEVLLWAVRSVSWISACCLFSPWSPPSLSSDPDTNVGAVIKSDH